jgi:hypothetical protein
VWSAREGSARVLSAGHGHRVRSDWAPDDREPLGYGVIGNTAVSGTAILGSSPGTPAETPAKCAVQFHQCFPRAPSSSGLGRRPLKAVARVQIPSGLPAETPTPCGVGVSAFPERGGAGWGAHPLPGGADAPGRRSEVRARRGPARTGRRRAHRRACASGRQVRAGRPGTRSLRAPRHPAHPVERARHGARCARWQAGGVRAPRVDPSAAASAASSSVPLSVPSS